MKRSQPPIKFENIDDRPFSRNSNGPELRSSHIGVLSSQVEDPPFLAETHRRSYRPPAGTKAIPRALRFQELSDTEPVDTEEEPKVVSLGDGDNLQTIGSPMINPSDIKDRRRQLKPSRQHTVKPTILEPHRTRGAVKREMENSKEDPPPDTTSTMNTKADNEEGEEAIQPNVALMVRSGPGIDSELFIVDTGCLGSHVFKNSNLLSRVTSVPENSHEVRDFSGNLHQTKFRGYLFNTNQHVLVMPHSKVNLLSTEQMFKDKLVSCAMVNGNALIFMNKHFQQVLKAVNRGNEAYVCTSDDLRKAFNNQPRPRSQINWTQPISIYHPNINETTVEVKPGHSGSCQP
jgi:hypothetical protein